MQNSVSKASKWKDFFKKKNKIYQTKQRIEESIEVTRNQIQKQDLNEQLISKKIEEKAQKQQTQNHNQTLAAKSQCKNNQSPKDEINLPQKNSEIKVNQNNNNQANSSNDEISKKTKNIMQILQLKDKDVKQPLVNKNTDKKHSQIKQPKKNQQLYQQKPQSTKCSTKLTKGHYKIFNPQHFNITEQQVKKSTHRWTYGTGQTPNQLLICSWNVNGIRARMNANDIGPYLDFIKPDIFCINEHKMDQKSYLQNPYKFWGYFSYWNFPKYSLGYSGVAVFSKYPAIQMWQDINVPQHSKQGRVITLQFDKFLLINVYIPTCGRELQRLKYRVQQYDPAFREYVLELQKKYPTKTVIICGDINVAHKQLDCHTGKRMLQGKQPAFTYQQRSSFTVFLRQAKMVDTFRHFYPNKRQYTWWNMRRGGRQRAGQTGIGKRLDYFLVDEKSLKYVKSSEIKKKVKGCDHCPIQMKIDFTQ